MNPLFELFKEKLKGQGVPAIIDRENGSTYISAANIYTSVIDRARELKKLGFSQDDILIDNPCGREAAINFLVCQYFDAIYFPLEKNEFNNFSNHIDEDEEYPSSSRRVFTLSGKICERNFSYLEVEKKYSLLLNTSGTYQKKTIGLTQEGILFQLQEHQKILETFPHEHKLSVLPKFHCFGLILDLLVGLLGNKYITLYEKGRFNINSLLEVFAADEVDFITGVPKQLEVLIRLAQEHTELQSILKNITFYVGGAPVNIGLEKRAKEIFKDLIIGYGLTEAGPGIMINHQVLPQVEVKYIDNHLFFRSPSVGDYGHKITQDGWVKTNDIFSGDTPRRPLGRSDDFSKATNGILHHSTQIEETVMKRFGVTAYILKNHTGKFAYFEKARGLEKARDFVRDTFPEITHHITINSKDILPLLEKNRGKSTKEILKRLITQKIG